MAQRKTAAGFRRINVGNTRRYVDESTGQIVSRATYDRLTKSLWGNKNDPWNTTTFKSRRAAENFISKHLKNKPEVMVAAQGKAFVSYEHDLPETQYRYLMEVSHGDEYEKTFRPNSDQFSEVKEFYVRWR